MALYRFQWNLTSGEMPGDTISTRHGGARRIGRQVFESGYV